MATVLESLKGINAYPIPLRTLVDAAEYRGLDMTVEVSQEIMQTAKYKLAQADLLLWLSLAPDVTQAGSHTASRTSSGYSSATGQIGCTGNVRRRATNRNPFTGTKVQDYDYCKRHNRNEDKDRRRDRP